MVDSVMSSPVTSPQDQYPSRLSPDRSHTTPQWNLGVGMPWVQAEAVLLNTALPSLLGGKSPDTTKHFRLKFFTEWVRPGSTWHASAFQMALTIGHRKVALDGVTVKEVTSLFPGLSSLINDAAKELDRLPTTTDLRDRGSDVGGKQVASAVHMAETYVDLGGMWLEKVPRFCLANHTAMNLFEFGLGMALHLSGLKVITEGNGRTGTASAFGWGGELSISLAIATIESPHDGWSIKPVVLETRVAGVFAGREFFGIFAAGAVSTQLARYF